MEIADLLKVKGIGREDVLACGLCGESINSFEVDQCPMCGGYFFPESATIEMHYSEYIAKFIEEV